MRKNLKIVLFIVAILIVSGGLVFGILVFTTWGTYEYSNTYYYEPSVPSPIEKVSFSSDVGKIMINYNKTPTDFFVKLDLDINIRGGFIEGKTFSDFFYPVVWLNESVSVVTFSLTHKSWRLFTSSENVTIDVTLRTDVVYDVNALTSTGSVNMNVPENVIINNSLLEASTGSISMVSGKNVTFLGNVKTETSTGGTSLIAKYTNFTKDISAVTSTGSLTMNLTNCNIGDDISGIVSTGSITLKIYNPIYSQESTWNLKTSTGSISVEIYQFVDMNSNVVGDIETSTGSINLIYKDNRGSVGASFFGTTSTGSYTRTSSGGGFAPSNTNPYNSLDYGTALNTYTLGLTTSTGSINVDGTSA
ncbi:MAG: hypothetical protein ACFFBI_03205 [Promethearchaeota archaeon]